MLNASQLYPACLPISIPVTDLFFNQPNYTRNCMNFVRSIAGPRLDCSIGYADQVPTQNRPIEDKFIIDNELPTRLVECKYPLVGREHRLRFDECRIGFSSSLPGRPLVDD